MFSVEMVRAFDQAFNDTERQGFLSLSRDLTSAMRCKFSFVWGNKNGRLSHEWKSILWDSLHFFTLQTFTDTSETVLNIQVL